MELVICNKADECIQCKHAKPHNPMVENGDTCKQWASCFTEKETEPFNVKCGGDINDNFIHTKHGYCNYSVDLNVSAIVFNLYVEQEYRRQGHARKLLQWVIREIREAGHETEIKIECIPRENNIDAERLISFYENMGLVVVKDT